MKFIDYYEVLGVPRSAAAKEIKTAYWKLAREHHPDLYQGDAKQNAEEQFKRINEAYEVLGDAEKREKYDRLGMNWRSGEDFAGRRGRVAGSRRVWLQRFLRVDVRQ